MGILGYAHTSLKIINVHVMICIAKLKFLTEIGPVKILNCATVYIYENKP